MSAILKELAAIVAGEVLGDENYSVNSIATLTSATPQQISFLSDNKLHKQLKTTQAGAIILNQSSKEFFTGNRIVVDDSYLAYAIIATFLHPFPESDFGIDDSACVHQNVDIDSSSSIGANCVIEKNVTIAKNVIVYAGCFIGRNSTIGANTRIHPNVVIKSGSVIGKRCIIDSGTVIGSDGFGFAKDKVNNRWVKIPQLGHVIIGDDVNIGSNTVIDRGALENTIISNGVIMDNLVHVAHNVKIGEQTAVAGCVGIAGSVTIGKNCMFAGQVGLSGHITVTDNVTVTGASNVYQNVKEAGVYSSGTPLELNKTWHKNYLRFKKLNDMAIKIKKLEKQFDEFNKQG